jgi:hypothetical protein
MGTSATLSWVEITLSGLLTLSELLVLLEHFSLFKLLELLGVPELLELLAELFEPVLLFFSFNWEIINFVFLIMSLATNEWTKSIRALVAK